MSDKKAGKITELKNKKARERCSQAVFAMAGVLGLEPRSTVLEYIIRAIIAPTETLANSAF